MDQHRVKEIYIDLILFWSHLFQTLKKTLKILVKRIQRCGVFFLIVAHLQLKKRLFLYCKSHFGDAKKSRDFISSTKTYITDQLLKGASCKPASLCLFCEAGWVSSTTTSRASSSSWREESTPTGTLTAAPSPTTWSASCLCAPSIAPWVHPDSLRVQPHPPFEPWNLKPNSWIFLSCSVPPEQSHAHFWEGELLGSQRGDLWWLPFSAGHGMDDAWSRLHARAVWRVSITLKMKMGMVPLTKYSSQSLFCDH